MGNHFFLSRLKLICIIFQKYRSLISKTIMYTPVFHQKLKIVVSQEEGDEWWKYLIGGVSGSSDTGWLLD